MNSDVPDQRIIFILDDVGLLEWDSIQSISSYRINYKSKFHYQYIQFFSTETDGMS